MLPEKIIDVIEDCGFRIELSENSYFEHEKYAEIEWFSSVDEDFIFNIYYADSQEFVNKLCEYAEDFDVDEHVAPLIPMRGEHGIPTSIRTLLESAEEFDKAVNLLAEKVCEAYSTMPESERIEKI